jgi:hypothetical protein
LPQPTVLDGTPTVQDGTPTDVWCQVVADVEQTWGQAELRWGPFGEFLEPDQGSGQAALWDVDGEITRAIGRLVASSAETPGAETFGVAELADVWRDMWTGVLRPLAGDPDVKPFLLKVLEGKSAFDGAQVVPRERRGRLADV